MNNNPPTGYTTRALVKELGWRVRDRLTFKALRLRLADRTVTALGGVR